jgi:hypothetical protein
MKVFARLAKALSLGTLMWEHAAFLAVIIFCTLFKVIKLIGFVRDYSRLGRIAVELLWSHLND